MRAAHAKIGSLGLMCLWKLLWNKNLRREFKAVSRTSSINHLKYAPQTLSPPIRSGLVDLAIVPDTDRLATWAPFT